MQLVSRKSEGRVWLLYSVWYYEKYHILAFQDLSLIILELECVYLLDQNADG